MKKLRKRQSRFWTVFREMQLWAEVWKNSYLTVPNLTRKQKRNYLISGGYGDLKGKTFRLAHMGNLQMDDINDVLNVLDEVLGEL